MSMFPISVITYPTNRYNPPWNVNLQFKDSYYINNFNVQQIKAGTLYTIYFQFLIIYL